MLACADIEEGIVLRRAGVRIPILVFGALGVSDLDGVFEFDLTPTISTPAAARAAAAARPQRAADGCACHLKIDTGMNRLGFRHDNLARTLPAIAASEHLAVDAVYTHFATADDPEHPAFGEQRERFERVPQRGLPALGHHAAASPRGQQRRAASRRARLVRLRPSRPAALRRRAAAAGVDDLPLRPALSLRSRIVHVKGMRAGEATGYGLTRRVEGREPLRSFPPAMPTASTAAWRVGPGCWCAENAYLSSDPCAWI